MMRKIKYLAAVVAIIAVSIPAYYSTTLSNSESLGIVHGNNLRHELSVKESNADYGFLQGPAILPNRATKPTAISRASPPSPGVVVLVQCVSFLRTTIQVVATTSGVVTGVTGTAGGSTALTYIKAGGYSNKWVATYTIPAGLVSLSNRSAPVAFTAVATNAGGSQSATDTTTVKLITNNITR